jgi:hypothetical protein
VDIWSLLGADLIQGVGYTGKAQKRNKAGIQSEKGHARARIGRAQAETVIASLGVSRP